MNRARARGHLQGDGGLGQQQEGLLLLPPTCEGSLFNLQMQDKLQSYVFSKVDHASFSIPSYEGMVKVETHPRDSRLELGWVLSTIYSAV